MRSAIIGLGAISTTHYGAIGRAGGEVVAICDIDEAKITAFCEKTGCHATAYKDYQALLSDRTIDVIHICTPHYLHADMVVAALRAGHHVLCEKPLCIAEEDIPRVLAAERESGKHLGVCHQNRYNESNLALKAMLESDPAKSGFGTVVWDRGEGYYASGAWRGKWQTEGGGVMINQALHTLDLLLWMVGQPDSVQADLHNRHLGGVIEVEDTASALFRYEDGRVFNFFATTASGADMPVQVMVATEGGQTIVAANDTITVNGEIRPSDSGDIRYGKDVWGDGHAKLVRDFYTCIKEDQPFAIDGREGARVVRAILAMYRSQGKEETLTV
ncbi:MAG: Gfo/Idh/MocA family oxidoreductase [Clostridia bacterium]|nr:Gfo/Idh/MocA family oxidoreductase [Clostridia bacterium]